MSKGHKRTLVKGLIMEVGGERGKSGTTVIALNNKKTLPMVQAGTS